MNFSKISSAFCSLEKNGISLGMHTIDLVFKGDRPFAVLDWEGPPGQLRPKTLVELDPKFLFHLGWAHSEYGYEHPISDTRTTP